MRIRKFFAVITANLVLLGILLPLERVEADGCLTPGFAPPVEYDRPYTHEFVVTGDFNKDGNPDLATSVRGTDSVSVLLGNADGTFRNVMSNHVGSLPAGIAAADLNHDGNVDLAVTSSGAGISLLFGKGDGSFQAVTNVSGAGHYLVEADFNGDGKADLVTTFGTVSMLLGNGDGTFQPATNVSSGGDSWGLAVGDLNGDGKPDLAVANSCITCLPSPANTLSVLLGNGDGTFQKPLDYDVGFGAQSVAIGDFNQDGKMDLASANSASDNVSVLLGNGDGTFHPATNYDTAVYPRSVAVADFNNDGKLDLALGTDSGISILLGNGDGTFQSAVTFITPRARDNLAIADFNHDGAPDLAVPFESLWVLLNICVPTLPEVRIVNTTSSVTVAWPYPSTGFVLQSTTSRGTTNWQMRLETPLTNSSQLEVTLPLDQQDLYFRLRKP